MNDKMELPKKSQGDYFHLLVKAVTASIPTIGGAAAELFAGIIAPPIEKRKAEWMESVTEMISDLESDFKTFKEDDLNNNDLFIDTIISTTKSMMATSSEIKKEKLLNALQNVALRNITNDDECTIFLNFIDRFTDAHITIFSILANPGNYRQQRGQLDTQESPDDLIKKQAGAVESDLVNIIVDELKNFRLITLSSDRLGEPPSFSQMPSTYLTKFGEKFTQFIAKPKPPK